MIDLNFLNYIWSNHADPLAQSVYEFRLLKKDETPIQHWVNVNLDSNNPVIKTLEAADQLGWDVYFGVMPRIKKDGKNESIRDWTQLLWADVDAKDGVSRLDIFNRLKNQPSIPDPQVVVDSGYGLHFYWSLDRPMTWEAAGQAMKGLADMLGGDHVYDKARILRVPGTHNHKHDDTRMPPPVRLMRYDLLTGGHSHDMFAAAIDRGFDLENPKELLQRRLVVARDWDVATKGLPQWVRDKMEFDPGKGRRSEHVFSVVCNLVEFGLDDDSIEDLIQSHPEGFGAKYHDRGMGHRWLSYTIKAARKAVEGGR